QERGNAGRGGVAAGRTVLRRRTRQHAGGRRRNAEAGDRSAAPVSTLATAGTRARGLSYRSSRCLGAGGEVQLAVCLAGSGGGGTAARAAAGGVVDGRRRDAAVRS